MRIISGIFGGTVLTDVGKGDTAAHLRPTSDRVRESLFNMLCGGRFGDPLTDARVLDLFAGSGALGLEALSQGADRVCFVDNGRAAYKLLSRNISKVRVGSRVNTLTKDATRLGPNPFAPFDLIFLDPPYGRNLGVDALTSALNGGWIADGALIVWEEDNAQLPPEGFTLLESKTYGLTVMTFLEVS